MCKRVLILDGAIYPETYQPALEWKELIDGIKTDSVHLPSGEKVPNIEEYSHIIVSGSEASITRPKPWFEIEVAAIQRAVALEKSILGSCFGHQMLMYAISGPEFVRKSDIPEIGWLELEVVENDFLLDGLGKQMRMFVLHFDEVITPPKPWKVIAKTRRCAVHVMRYGARRIWGIQAHPETSPERARELMEGIVAHQPDKEKFIEPALGTQPADDGVAAEIVRRFLD